MKHAYATLTRVAEVDLTITFDGPGITAGRMRAKDLAASLVAMADLLHEAQHELFPADRRVSVEIDAAEDGSFKVHLVVVHTIYDRIVSIFSSDDVASVVNLTALVGSVGALFGLLAKRATRRVAAEEVDEEVDKDQTTIRFDDGTTITVPTSTARLARSYAVRHAAREVVRVLETEEVDTLVYASEQATEVTVTSAEVPGFELPEAADETLLESEREAVLSIVSAAFTEGNKWKLSDGESVFWVAIQDDSFLARVERGETFAKQDLLRVQLKTRQSRTESGLRAEHTIMHVIEHIEGNRPVQLPLDEAGTL